MTIAVFKVFGKLGMAGASEKGTFAIDRETKVVTVRRNKSRTAYQMSLNQVANFVCERGVAVKTERKKTGEDDGQPEGG